MQKRGGTMATVVGRGEREEELALFHEVCRRERERKSNAVHPLPHDADQPQLESTHTHMQHHLTSSAAKLTSTHISSKPVYDPITADLNKKGDDLLIAELGKNDYDWLLTPPGTPLINPSDHNSASNGDDFLSRAEPLSSVRSLAAIKTSRFSSSKTEPNLKKEGTTLLAKPDLALRKGQSGLSRSNGLTGSSLYTTNNATAMATKKTPGSRPSSRPTSPTKRPTIPSTHTARPTTPTSRPKPTSTPRSHPTTPTSRPSTALASRSGSNSVSPSSMISRKTGVSSPAMTPIRSLAAPQTQTHQPLSAGASRSPSVGKARPLPSRSAPSSRGSSPTTKPYVWQQALVTPTFSSDLNGTNLTILPTTNSSRTTPSSMNSRGSRAGFSSRPGAAMSTTQATFSSLNQLGTSSDISRKPCSPSLTREKSSLLNNSRTERQSSASLTMSRNSIHMDKSLGDIAARNTKVGDKMLQSRRPLASSLSPDTTWSVLQTKHLREKSALPVSSRENGIFSKHAPRRSLDTSTQNLNLRQNTSNGLCPLVSSTPISSLYSARHVKMQTCSNDLSLASYSNASADYSIMTLREQEGSKLSEGFLCGSDFRVSPARQSELLISLGKDAHVNNWLGNQENMDEGLMQVFEQGIDKFQGSESPLVCPHGGGAANCDLCNVKMRLQMLNEKSKASFGAISQIMGEA